MNWQPIETAPKDGRGLLCVMGGRVVIAYWHDDKYARNPRPFWSTWDISSRLRDRAQQPKWWMPLPEVPKDGETCPKCGEG